MKFFRVSSWEEAEVLCHETADEAQFKLDAEEAQAAVLGDYLWPDPGDVCEWLIANKGYSHLEYEAKVFCQYFPRQEED